MNRVQIVFKPTESKELICRGLIASASLRWALAEGIVAIHPSSTTYFLYKMITGEKPEGVWLVGMITPRGTCIEGLCHQEFEKDNYKDLSNPSNFPFTWVFRKGKLETGYKLADILAELGPGDLYIKGVNAVDAYGWVAVLLASLAGGTIGKVLKAQKERGFRTIYVAGQEKFLPVSLKETAKETGRPVTKDAMGIPCGLLPIEADVFNEIKAWRLLANVEAIPFAAGGVAGAEGSTMMVLKGEEEDLTKAMNLAREIKGAKLPDVIMPDCLTCRSPGCLFAGKEIGW